MVKLLVDLHGGSVGVESTLGQGSCFSVWLPWRPSDEGAFAPHRDSPAPAPGTPVDLRTALVVEDDPRAGELIQVQLEAEGFTVIRAGNAVDALALAMQQPLALITLDIMLPGMDGWELLACVHAIPSLQRIPIVVMSIVADREKGFSLGAAAVLQKPVSRRELYDSLVGLGLFPLSEV
jgi:CheY-like chemotaxis protein